MYKVKVCYDEYNLQNEYCASRKKILVGNLQSLAEEEQTEGEELSPPSSGSLESGPLRYELKPSSGELRDNLQNNFPIVTCKFAILLQFCIN